MNKFSTSPGGGRDFLEDSNGRKIRFSVATDSNFFAYVDCDYIEESSNRIGLPAIIGSCYDDALRLLLDMCVSSPQISVHHLSEEVSSAAEMLFGLLHVRFILSQKGLKRMEEKFLDHEFGTCSRVFCDRQALLPVGLSDTVRESPVMLFCPQCEEVYHLPSTQHTTLDGAYWGTTFPHLLLLDLREKGTHFSLKRSYVPRIYGMRVYKPGREAETYTDEKVK